MSSINILSIAPGSPTSKSAQWLRIRTIANALSEKFNVNFYCILQKKIKFSALDTIKSLNLKYNLISLSDPNHLNRLLKYDKKPNLIYSNTHIPAIFSPIFRLKKIPIMFDMHGVAFFEKLELYRHHQRYRLLTDAIPNFLVEQMAIKSASSILCVSKQMISYLHNIQKKPMENLHFITNGVDLNHFRQYSTQEVQNLKSKIGINDEFIFGYIGNLQEWQGANNLLKAAKGFDKPNVKFLVVGGNSAWSKDKIIQLKKVPYNEVPLYYSICDVLVLPRPYNQVTTVAAPTKFAEYTAMGKPVLVTNVGDAPLFVKQYQCGEIVKSNDPKDLAAGFSTFLTHSGNSLKEMGRNSRNLAETTFDWKKITNNLVDIITKRYAH